MMNSGAVVANIDLPQLEMSTIDPSEAAVDSLSCIFDARPCETENDTIPVVSPLRGIQSTEFGTECTRLDPRC